MKKKENIIAIIVLIVFFIVEIGLIKIGPMIWGAEKAYHIWGMVNVGLMVIGVIGTVISNIVKKK